MRRSRSEPDEKSAENAALHGGATPSSRGCWHRRAVAASAGGERAASDPFVFSDLVGSTEIASQLDPKNGASSSALTIVRGRSDNPAMVAHVAKYSVMAVMAYSLA